MLALRNLTITHTLILQAIVIALLTQVQSAAVRNELFLAAHELLNKFTIANLLASLGIVIEDRISILNRAFGTEEGTATPHLAMARKKSFLESAPVWLRSKNLKFLKRKVSRLSLELDFCCIFCNSYFSKLNQ